MQDRGGKGNGMAGKASTRAHSPPRDPKLQQTASLESDTHVSIIFFLPIFLSSRGCVCVGAWRGDCAALGKTHTGRLEKGSRHQSKHPNLHEMRQGPLSSPLPAWNCVPEPVLTGSHVELHQFSVQNQDLMEPFEYVSA